MEWLRKDADAIISAGINAVLPDEAVKRALAQLKRPGGRLIPVAAGKAAWQMAKAASDMIDADAGIVVTKYDHVMGELPGIECYEAGHPVPDQNGFDAAARAVELTGSLS